MTTISQYSQPQWQARPGAAWPQGYGPPPPSTRMLTTTKWLTVGIVGLLIPLVGLWIYAGYEKAAGMRELAGLVAGKNSGDGKGLKGGAEAIAWLELMIVIQWATLAGVVALGVVALLAGPGRSWVRIACTILLLFPIGVVIFGVIDGGSRALWALVFLLPFLVLAVLWWRPGTSQGLRARLR